MTGNFSLTIGSVLNAFPMLLASKLKSFKDIIMKHTWIFINLKNILNGWRLQVIFSFLIFSKAHGIVIGRRKNWNKKDEINVLLSVNWMKLLPPTWKLSYPPIYKTSSGRKFNSMVSFSFPGLSCMKLQQSSHPCFCEGRHWSLVECKFGDLMVAIWHNLRRNCCDGRLAADQGDAVVDCCSHSSCN